MKPVLAVNVPKGMCQLCLRAPKRKGKGQRYCDGCERNTSMATRQRRRHEGKVIQRRQEHGLEMSLNEAAESLGVSTEGARNIEARALKRFEHHWRVLMVLAPAAGIRVDWDWLLRGDGA